jgi:peptidoglycan/LPS O-acetylase OafA/YrhL
VFRSPSVDDVLKQHRGVGPGFDFWRVSLSTGVILLHSFHVTVGTVEGGEMISFLGPFFAAMLPIFFGVSGFLVTGSALRTGKVTTFLAFRALRIVPALAAVTTLSAVVLGPFVTTYPLHRYFTSHTFFSYFANIVGAIHFHLPGVFNDNPVPTRVNQNLWTLDAELLAYIILASAMILRILHRRRVILAIWAIVTLAMFGLSLTKHWFLPDAGIYPLSDYVYCFLTGVVAFIWRDRIPVSKWYVAGALATYLLFFYVNPLSFLAMLPLTYIMIWVGLQPTLAFWLFKKGDYSYGLYLYGFVVQQTIVLLLPGLRFWWFNFPASLLVTFVLAVASWHIVEKPALGLKRLLSPRAAAPAGTPHPHEQRASELARLDAAEHGIGQV